jgi:hypothetical protein
MGQKSEIIPIPVLPGLAVLPLIRFSWLNKNKLFIVLSFKWDARRTRLKKQQIIYLDMDKLGLDAI